MGLFDELGKLFKGTPAKFKQRSRLGPEQQPLYGQLQEAIQGPGAGGAFGQAADYYRDTLSDDSETAEAMFRPELRRFREEIIPGLSEQFAGMGSGGLSSSGFRNAAVNAGTDLSERLGAIRANLRQQAAQGLTGLGQAGLQDFNEYYQSQPGSPGLLSSAAQGFGQGLTGLASNWISGKGKTSPYGELNDMSNSIQQASLNPIRRG